MLLFGACDRPASTPLTGGIPPDGSYRKRSLHLDVIITLTPQTQTTRPDSWGLYFVVVVVFSALNHTIRPSGHSHNNNKSYFHGVIPPSALMDRSKQSAVMYKCLWD